MIIKQHRGKVKSRSTQTKYIAPSTKTYRISDGAFLLEFGGGELISDTNEESIASGSQPTATRYLPCSCVHRKTRSSTPSSGMITSLWYNAASPTVRQESWTRGNATREALGAVTSAFLESLDSNSDISFLASNAHTLMAEAWPKLKPNLTEVSVPNFLLDIKQIRGLINVWRASMGLLKNIAALNLNIQYGWRPTFGDLNAAVHSILNLQRKIREWNKRLGKITTRRVTVRSDSESSSGSFDDAYYHVAWRGTIVRKATAHAVFRPLPIAQMTGLERVLRGSLQSLGFRLDLGIVWDAIPFSFVVDWFFNIGDYLGQFEVDTLELPIKLESTYLQYKEDIHLSWHVTEKATSDHALIEGTTGTWDRSLFHRMFAAPDYLSLKDLGWKFPSLNKALLGVSLILTGRK